MNDIILSICIPTYNRSNYLRQALESIHIQLKDNPSLMNTIEVVISDNNSEDNTTQIVEQYKNSIKNLTYSKLERNLGFDKNVLNLIKNAYGRYCWYLGDDDIIINGGIEYVYSKIESDKYDFIGLTAEHLKEKANDQYKTKKIYSDNQIITIKDFNDFYFKGYCQGGVSVLVFNRKLWMEAVNEDDFLDHWLYYETVLKILVSTKKDMAFIQETTVLTGQDCRWSENGGELFTFGNSNLLLEKMIIFGFDKERVIQSLTRNSEKLVLILLRAKGHDLKCNFTNLDYMWKATRRASWESLIIATLIFFIPNIFVKAIRDTKKYISRSLLSRQKHV